MNCTHSVVKIMGLSSILNRPFHLALFGSIMSCSFGKYWLLSSANRSSKRWLISFYKTQSPIFNTTTDLIKKAGSTGKLSKFSKLLNFTEELEYYYWQQILPLVHEMMGSFFLLLRQCLLDTQFWITHWLVIQIKMGSYEGKAATWACKSITQMFFPVTSSALGCHCCDLFISSLNPPLLLQHKYKCQHSAKASTT